MRIVVTDCDHANMNEETQVLSKAGLSFEHKKCVTEDDLIRDCKGANILLNQYAPITRKVMQALRPELGMVVRYGVGVNNVDVQAATELGVLICNVPDYGMQEVSDHALAMTMDLARKITFMDNAVRKGSWNYEDSVPLFRLADQTLGIVGLGRNGRTFADKARHIFGNIIGYDPYYRPNDADGSSYIKGMELSELLSAADIVVLHLPLTPETKNIIDAAAMAKMKPTAYLVNTSRGGLIDEAALDKALEAKIIAGAALDVTESEPLPGSSPLFRHANFICTPHMAWYSEQASLELKRKVAEEAVRFAKGEECRNIVNKKK